MELKVKMKLNPKTEIETVFEGANIQDVILAAGCILDFDGACGLCKSENITLQTRVTKEKGFKYTEFVCRDCRAKRQMGEYRDGKGYFLKGWEEGYKGDDKE
jgi:hypothetical protein